jgi:hypothetical protein
MDSNCKNVLMRFTLKIIFIRFWWKLFFDGLGTVKIQIVPINQNTFGQLSISAGFIDNRRKAISNFHKVD